MGRAIVASRPCVDPFKRCDKGRKYCDYHRNSKKCDGGMVAIPPVKHKGTSTLTWKRYGACVVPRGQTVMASPNRGINLRRFVPDFEYRHWPAQNLEKSRPIIPRSGHQYAARAREPTEPGRS